MKRFLIRCFTTRRVQGLADHAKWLAQCPWTSLNPYSYLLHTIRALARRAPNPFDD